MGRGVSTGLVILGLVIVVVAVAVTLLYVMPMLRPHPKPAPAPTPTPTPTPTPVTNTTKTTKPTPPPPPPQEVALNNSIALLTGQYTAWYSLVVNASVIATSHGLTLSFPILYLNTSRIEVSWSNTTGQDVIYFNGFINVNYTKALFAPQEHMAVLLVFAAYRNGTQVCTVTGQPLANLTSGVPTSYTGALACTPLPSNAAILHEFKDVVVNNVLGNLTYIGNTTWSGETAYCFATRQPVMINMTQVLPALLSTNATVMNVTSYLVVNITGLCLLESGIATYVQGSVTLVLQSQNATAMIPVDFTASLLNYTTIFDTQGFNALLKNPYPVPTTTPMTPVG